jgi:hypothetical protein
VDNRAITGLGFQPEAVIIKAVTAQYAVMRTSTMSGDLTKAFVGATALQANLIQSLDADGFTIGTDARVNSNGIAYHWIAFKAMAGEIGFGTYTGDDTDSRDIAGLGFQPDLVFLLPESTQNAVARFSSQSGDASLYFNAAAQFADGIQALNADGFQVGTTVNANATVYHYVAWKEVWGKRAIGSYTGNGTDNRSIAGLGFEPKYVLIKAATAQAGVHKPNSTGALTDTTLYFTNTASFANGIQKLETDGFQLGNNNTVNANGTTYHYAAFALNLTANASISSAANQIFTKGDGPTAISPITVTDAAIPMITTGNDIRIRIPYWFNMTWDTTVTTAVIGGGAAGKVSTAVSYENAGKILVIDVLTNFGAGETITVSGLRFANFTARSYPDNLELEVLNDDAVTSTDDKTIAVLDPADAAKALNPVANLEAIPAGSLVIAMDNDKQIADGSAFNIRAYGLVNSLLWSEIPVKWAIRAGKAKDGIDFSATAQRLYPSAVPAAALDFRGGPFIVHKYFAHDAKNVIEAFGNSVAVYELTADATVDVRYTLEHKPRIAVLDDGGNAAIHMAVLANAGFVSGTHYEHVYAASLATINASMCYTFASEPHYGETPPTSDGPVQAIRNFVQSGGNFLAECAAVESYENNPTYGRFQTTNGITVTNSGGSSMLFDHPDLSYSQFQGALAPGGGSVKDWMLNGGSWQNNGHIHVKNSPATNTFIATASKLTNGAGSLVFYQGSHDYEGTTLPLLNGQRMYLNAVLTPSARPTNCNPYFPTQMAPAKIYSASDQIFAVNQESTPISLITVLESNVTTMTAGNDIRITIPAGTNMTWDTTDLTAIFGGSAAGKVSPTVSYEDGGKTLVINVLTDFAPFDDLTIAGLSYANFTASSPADYLSLEVDNSGTIVARDDESITIVGVSISSAADQSFVVGDPATAISPITVRDDPNTAQITAGNDIRITIPGDLYMTWNTADLAAIIGGPAAGKVSTTVSYEDGGKTLVLNVTSDFAPGEYITVDGLSYANFTQASDSKNLGLEIYNDGTTTTLDDKWIAIGGAPTPCVLAYGEGTVITPRYQYWDGTAFGAELTAQSAAATINWTVLKASPVANEMILGVYSTATKALYIQTLSGGTWTANWSSVLGYGGATRVFDIAYERNTGDVIVVFGNNAGGLYYRKRVGGVWDSADQPIGAITMDKKADWVRAKSHPANDDIFVATVSDNPSLYALRWNGAGNAWDNVLQTTLPVADKSKEGFDLAFERASGNAFLIWGDTAKQIQYRRFTTSWQAGVVAYSGLTNNAVWLKAAYDPVAASSNIAIAFVRSDDFLGFGAWNGTTWVTRPAAIQGQDANNRSIDVAFEEGTGEAVYAFSTKANAAQLSYYRWTSAAGFVGPTLTNGTTGTIKFVQLKTIPGSDDLMAVYADNNADLWYRYWDGSAFTLPSAPPGTALELTLSGSDKLEAFCFDCRAAYKPTAVDLLSFTATGAGSVVKVIWETAQEVNNLGFHLYRATSRQGPFTKLNDKLIPGTSFLVEGDTYTYRDTRVIPWRLYYYQLEDVDIHGIVTSHGPICVDWDGDGIADDWEIAHGLNPRVKDGGGDPDGDGVTNLMEYKRGTDPLNPDSDGDGILDGSDLKRDRVELVSSSVLGPGVRVIATGETGITLELATEGVLSEKVQVGDAIYDRIRVPSYIHGYTHEVGKPELPVKGILLDLPEGASARLRVGQCDSRSYPGVLVYPVPARVGEDRGGVGQVSEVFALDQSAYATDSFYPGAVAALGETFTFRDQRKLQILFYPLSFNPVTGELIQYTKIQVRIDYEKPSLLGRVISKVLAAGVAEAPELSGEVSALGGGRLAAWSPPSAGAAYRVLVADEGMYRLTSAWFVAQGIDPSGMELSEIRLYNEGQEAAIAVHDGDGNNRLDGGDAIEFYGRAPSSSYSKYARYNVYWLTISGGSGSPKRMAELDGTPGVGAIPATHTSMVHHEENRWYWLGAPGDDSLERWFFYPFVDGSGIEGGGGAVGFTLSLPGVSGTGALMVRLGAIYDTEHEVALAVNGTPMGSIAWSGIGFTEATFENVDFLPGANTVTLQCLSGTDSIAVDWFEATYPRAFEASGDALTFTADGGYRFQVSGFSGSEIELFDVTLPAETKRISDFQVTGSGPYTVEFEPAEMGQRTYVVLASSALKTPAGITRDTPSTLASSANGADYILVTHRMLGWDGGGSPQPWLKRLVSLRQGQGLRVKVVDIQDVFDEFGYGIETPQAVKDFLAYAYASWQRPAPQYVLLVGDSTYDPKGNWGWYLDDRTATYLPTYLALTPHVGETVTDEWFVRVSGDDLVPDLYIGRLPAATAAEAEVMVGKIVSYETAPNTKSWEKSVVLVSDNAAEDYETIFEQMNEDAAALLPASMGSPFKGYLADYLSVDDLTFDIKSQINSGALLVNYSGHGSTQILAHEGIFDTGDVAALGNGEKLPFFVSMTCLAGYFAYPESWSFPSLAEALLRAEGKGAAAALMPTGMTTPEGQHVLDRALLDAIFTQDIRTLGPAISSAKQTLLANDAGYGEVGETFLLFGDPAMGLKVPLPRRVSGGAAGGTKNGVSLTWQAAFDCNGKAVSGYNLYRATSAGGTYVKVNSALITGLSFADTGLAGGGTYYYVVTAVDGNGLESARSQVVSATAGSGSSGGGDGGGSFPGGSGGGGGSSGGGGGCFVATAADRVLGGERLTRLAAVILAASALVLLVALSLRKRHVRRRKP